jgi:hypothetical protein
MFALKDFWRMQKSAKIVSSCLFLACVIIESFWYARNGLSETTKHWLNQVSSMRIEKNIIPTAFAQTTFVKDVEK